MIELEYLSTKINLKKDIGVIGQKEVFKVTKINDTNPIMYTIQDLNNEKIQGSFYTEELQKSEF